VAESGQDGDAKALVDAAPDAPAVSFIGACPVQELLSKHGERLIERIEQQAAVDAEFRACLTVVNPNWLSEEILDRLTKAIDNQ
jgi:hypothetical protein